MAQPNKYLITALTSDSHADPDEIGKVHIVGFTGGAFACGYDMSEFEMIETKNKVTCTTCITCLEWAKGVARIKLT